MAIIMITRVLKTLKLWSHLNSLSQPLSLALFVKGIIKYPTIAKDAATRAKYTSRSLKNRKEIKSAMSVIKNNNK